ncbi:MAG TPA: helix-turn-helix transcriptional regulator, partial [Candidatus Saccharimonadales bacterium]|nr:helix-turn-helix transcriptional regulator [Candidatus Saccharimonadales bacterium]
HIRALPTSSTDRLLLVITREPEGSLSAIVTDDPSLSNREMEVARWICNGKSNSEIARILGISPRTVHKHVEHIFERLGVESRVALTVRLMKNFR